MVRGNGSMNNQTNESIYHVPSSFPSKYVRLNEKPVYRRTDKRDMNVYIYLKVNEQGILGLNNSSPGDLSIYNTLDIYVHIYK